MTRALAALLVALGLAACAAPAPQTGPVRGLESVTYTGALRVAPDPVQVGDALVGCVQRTGLALSNGATGSAPLTVTRVVTQDPAVRLAGAFPMTLAPGETREAALFTTPARPGTGTVWLGFVTDEGPGAVRPLRVEVRGLEPAGDARARPLDLVFVVDVSTSMNEVATLRAAIADLFDFVAGEGLDVRFGLTTVENDVIVHRRGAFLDREAFFAELDSQLVEGSWIPDASLPRQLLNFELEENLLDALHRSATDFDFRPEARRFLFLMTDDTFLEPPAVFSDGNEAVFSYAEVARILSQNEIGLFSVHVGEKGRGLSESHRGEAGLVTATGGAWMELAAVRRDSLQKMLDELLNRPDCR